MKRTKRNRFRPLSKATPDDLRRATERYRQIVPRRPATLGEHDSLEQPSPFKPVPSIATNGVYVSFWQS